MAKAAKAKTGSGASLIWFQGLACGGMAAIAPTATLQVALLLAPGLASLVLESQDGKPVTRAMLLFGLAASVEPVRQNWSLDGALGGAWATDPMVILFAWVAAAAGWLLARAVPAVVSLVLDTSHQARADALRLGRVELVRAWGLEEDETPPGSASPGKTDTE